MTMARRYDDIAAVYDRVMGQWSREDIPALLLAARIEPGSRVLDVATGTGEVAGAAAGTVGRSGYVVGVDLSFGMLTVARRKTSGVPFVVMNAETLACRDFIFDAVICWAALPLFPDVSRALREFRRVLRVGGRLALSVWPSPERVPIYGMFLEAVARQLPAHAHEIMLGFSLADVNGRGHR